MRTCHCVWHWHPEDRNRDVNEDRSAEMMIMTLTARYARYLLTSLAAVAFGIPLN